MRRMLPVFLLFILTSVPVWGQDHTDVVTAVKAELVAAGTNLAGPCGAFAITGRVAWLLRSEGWGLITKNPGQNGCSVEGRDRYAIDALAQQDGSQWVDLLINSETDNTPAWQLHAGSGQPSSEWAAPFDMGGPPGPGPSPSTDHNVIVDLLGELQLQMSQLKEQTTNFRQWAETEIAAVRAEHKAQNPKLDKGTPIWQIIIGILGAIAGGVGATK